MSDPGGMTRMMHTVDVEADAAAAAAAVARAAGVTVRTVSELDELARAVDLIGGIWGREDAPPVIALDLVRALSHAGGYVAGAFADGEMIGASMGFLGRSDGQASLHSHVTGVAPAARSRGIGFMLKQHQRAWALAHGIGQVTWTFDPLVRRNAYFNISRLAATASTYLPDFYGPMQDALNRGDESDRLFVRWDLRSDAAVRAAAREPLEPDLDALRAAGAQVVLGIEHDEPRRVQGEADVRLCVVPEDIVALRRDDLPRALAWRRALRDALGGALADGLHVSGFARAGWYVLERP